MKVNHLTQFKEFITETQLSPDDFCIVGSAVLATLGIRENNDVDFICLRQNREEIKELLNKRKDKYNKVDLVKEDWIFFDENYTDDILINSQDNHYNEYGLKFVNIELLFRRKSVTMRKKDKMDLDKIREYIDRSEN
jgi:nuclear transport factor 2 (NTF2) superfamily protein